MLHTVIHLKIWPNFWEQRRAFNKEWELRIEDDKTFREGNILVLQVWDPEAERYTGDEEVCLVRAVSRDIPGIADDFALLSTETIHVHHAKCCTYLDLSNGQPIDDDEMGITPDCVELKEAARIVREHKDRQARLEQTVKVNTAQCGKTNMMMAQFEAELGSFVVHGNIPESEAGEWALHESGAAFHITPGDPGPDGHSWTFACAAQILKTRKEEKEGEARAEQANPFEGVTFERGAIFKFLHDLGPIDPIVEQADGTRLQYHKDGTATVLAPRLPGAAGLAEKVQEIQEKASKTSPADRFESCLKNEVCTPHGCEAGGGKWPRCPTGAENAQETQAGPGPRPTVCPSPAPPPKRGEA